MVPELVGNHTLEVANDFGKAIYKFDIKESNFKPEDNAIVTFSQLVQGQSAWVKIAFKANPKPTSGIWHMGKETAKIGEYSQNRTFLSNKFTNGTEEHEYLVKLHFTMKEGK